MGGTESQGISRAGQTVSTKMSLRYGSHLLALWLCGDRVQKMDNGLCLPFSLGKSCPPALALMPDTSVPPCMLLVPFKLLPQCWSSEEVSLNKSLCGFFKRNCLELQKFLPLTQLPLVFAATIYETYLSVTGAVG